MEKSMRGGLACGVGSGALWGLVFLAPAIVPDFTTIELSAGRYLCYGVVSLLAMLLSGRTSALALLRKTRPEHWWLATRLALIGNLVYYVLLSAAVQNVGVAAASLIIGTLPVTITLLGARGRDIAAPGDSHGLQDAGPGLHGPRLCDLAPALLLILVGIACINADVFSGHAAATSEGSSGDWHEAVLGISAAVGALAAWTWYAVGNARGLDAHPTFTNAEWAGLQGLVSGVMALMIWAVLAVLLYLPLPYGNVLGIHHAPFDRQIVFWSVNIALAVGASWMGNTLWNAAARRLPLTLSGQMIVFETLFALLYGFIHAQRLPRLLEIAAIVLLVIGVMWSVRLHAPGQRQSPTPTQAD